MPCRHVYPAHRRKAAVRSADEPNPECFRVIPPMNSGADGVAGSTYEIAEYISESGGTAYRDYDANFQTVTHHIYIVITVTADPVGDSMGTPFGSSMGSMDTPSTFDVVIVSTSGKV